MAGSEDRERNKSDFTSKIKSQPFQQIMLEQLNN